MVARACASPRNSIWFTGLFFLRWGLRTTLHDVWAQDHKMQALVQSNIEAWMVKPLSAGCINTAVAGWVLIIFWLHSDCVSQKNWQYTRNRKLILHGLIPYSSKYITQGKGSCINLPTFRIVASNSFAPHLATTVSLTLKSERDFNVFVWFILLPVKTVYRSSLFHSTKKYWPK